jgi:4-diphosphocytidyl-2C-methyl-D-erythritol kinase
LTQNTEIANFLTEKNYRREEPGRATYFNRLQSVAEGLEPRLREVRRSAEARFGVPFTLTGSGSAYFGEVGNEPGGGRFEVRGCGTVRALLVETTGTERSN